MNFYVGPEVLRIFGIPPFARVVTPKGNATAIGVYQSTLWFHIDNELGASFWEGVKNYEGILRNNIFMEVRLNFHHLSEIGQSS